MSEVKEQTEVKDVTVSDEQLAELVAQNSKLQEKESEGEGVKADYILLAKAGTKALKRSEKDLFIEGLAIGDIFIQKDKIKLGSRLKVVPLAFITIYNERDHAGQNAKFFGVWNKEQAVQFPLVEGSYFNRQLPNGHVLVPVNWVMVTVLGHHEIENGVIAFKSTGSRIWKKWKEDAKGRSGSSATLVYEIFEESYKNPDYEWTDFGFKYVENLLETDKNEAVFCLKKSNVIREAYDKATLIGNHSIASVTSGSKATVMIEDASETPDSTDDDSLGF